MMDREAREAHLAQLLSSKDVPELKPIEAAAIIGVTPQQLRSAIHEGAIFTNGHRWTRRVPVAEAQWWQRYRNTVGGEHFGWLNSSAQPTTREFQAVSRTEAGRILSLSAAPIDRWVQEGLFPYYPDSFHRPGNAVSRLFILPYLNGLANFMGGQHPKRRYAVSYRAACTAERKIL